MIMETSKRQQYAKEYRLYASVEFAQMVKTGKEVVIDVKTWHEFLFLTDRLPEDWSDIPTPDDKVRWAFLHRVGNRVRREMNRASKTGDGGEPPFELVVKTGIYRLRPIQSMALVTYGEVGKMVEVYLKNKRKDLMKTHAFLEERVKSGEIEGALAAHVGALTPMWNRAIKNAAHQITGYLEDVEAAKQAYEEMAKGQLFLENLQEEDAA